MLTAIDFNYELFLKANKIDNIDSHRLLAAEFDSIQLLISQLGPEHFLGFCLPASEPFCQARSLQHIHVDSTPHLNPLPQGARKTPSPLSKGGLRGIYAQSREPKQVNTTLALRAWVQLPAGSAFLPTTL